MLLSSLLFANDSNSDYSQLSLEDLLTVDVTTASKKAESSGKAPATIYVVTEAMIRERGYRNLAELLADIPEVEIQRKSQREFQDLYSFRGVFGNEKFIILLDGFRFSSPTGSPHAVGMNYPLHQAKQVEVILGPASALYGADAFGGIVNIISRPVGETALAALGLEAGSFGSRLGSFSYGRTFDKLKLSLAGMGYESDEPDLSKYYTDDFAQNAAAVQGQSQETNPPGLIESNMGFAMPVEANFFQIGLETGQFQFGHSANSESHSSSTGMRPEFARYVEEAAIEVRIESTYGKHTYNSEDGRWSLQSSFWRGSFEMRPESHFMNIFSNFAPAYKYEKGSNQKFEEQFNYNFREETSIVLGASSETISTTPQTGDLPFALDPDEALATQGAYYLGTNVVDRNGNDLTVPQEFYHVDYKNYGFYAQLQTRSFKRLDWTIGARYDQNTRFGSTFNPRLGMVLTANEKLTLKLLYGRSYFAPSPYLSYQHYGSFTSVDAQGRPTTDPQQIDRLAGNFWHLPNPELKPEHLASYEFNLAYYFNKNWALFMDGFTSKVSDRIVNRAEGSGAFLGIPVAVIERPDNVGTAKSSALTTRLSGLFVLFGSRFNLAMAHTYAEGEINDGELPYTAKQTFKSQLNWQYRGLNLNLNLLSRSKGYHLGNSGEPAFVANRAYTLANLYASIKPALGNNRYKPEFYLRIENLLDKRYYNSSRDGSDSFAATPQDPLRLSAGLQLGF